MLLHTCGFKFFHNIFGFNCLFWHHLFVSSNWCAAAMIAYPVLHLVSMGYNDAATYLSYITITTFIIASSVSKNVFSLLTEAYFVQLT